MSIRIFLFATGLLALGSIHLTAAVETANCVQCWTPSDSATTTPAPVTTTANGTAGAQAPAPAPAKTPSPRCDATSLGKDVCGTTPNPVTGVVPVKPTGGQWVCATVYRANVVAGKHCYGAAGTTEIAKYKACAAYAGSSGTGNYTMCVCDSGDNCDAKLVAAGASGSESVSASWILGGFFVMMAWMGNKANKLG